MSLTKFYKAYKIHMQLYHTYKALILLIPHEHHTSPPSLLNSAAQILCESWRRQFLPVYMIK